MAATKLQKMLAIDACGETTVVVAGLGEEVMAQRELGRGRGSAEMIEAVDAVLRQAGWALRELDAVGVVSGPGSFTGVRVGLAAAKGLCEACGARMVAVSRLDVLLESDGGWEIVAADAGRGELYVRERHGAELLMPVEELQGLARGRKLLLGDAKSAEALAGEWPVAATTGKDVLRTVLRRMAETNYDDVLADANYVRREADIYKKHTGEAK